MGTKKQTVVGANEAAATQTIKFDFYQFDKHDNVAFTMANSFEVKSDADFGAIAYFLLRPLSVMFQRKIQLDAAFSKVKGNTKKAKLPFSASRACYFRLNFNGKQIHTHSIKDVGGVDYFSNIKIAGKFPLHNAHIALVEALKVVFNTSKLDTTAKIKANIVEVDAMANGIIEVKEQAKAILKAAAAKPKSKSKAKKKVVVPAEPVLS